MTDSHWLAWAAGIIDGEGCISIVQSRSSGRAGLSYVRYVTRVSVVNTDARMIQKLLGLFGGQLKTEKPEKAGWKVRHVWVLHALKAETFLVSILPWLVIKKEQADIAIASRSLRHGPKGRPRSSPRYDIEGMEWFRREITRLKVEIPSEWSRQDIPRQGGIEVQMEIPQMREGEDDSHAS